jgi:hypothetical protein
MTNEASTGPVTPDGPGSSVEDAAARFERLLSQEDTQKKRSRGETRVTPEVEAKAEDEGIAAEAEETAPEAPEEAPEDEAEAPTDAPEEGAEGEDEAEQVYTVKVDGKEIEVPLTELLKGYSRTADYTRKTEALAHEKRAFQAEAERVREQSAIVSNLVPALTAQLQASLPQPPDPSLRDIDYLAYSRMKEDYEMAVGKLQAAMSQTQQLQQLQIEEQMQVLSQQVEQGRAKLPDLVPAWKDPKAYERDRPRLREYAKKLGYSDDEIDQAYDPRAVAALYKAMRYDEIVSRKPRPDTPLEKVIRPRPSTVAPAASAKRVSHDARTRLAQTGSVDDAAAAIRSLL